MNIVSVNGKLTPAAEASVSIDERGFRFGDGVFETLRVTGGIPYLLSYHLERMATGLAVLGIAYDVSVVPALAATLIEANNASNCMLRVYISRGIGSQGYLPSFPPATPTVLLQLLPLPKRPEAPVKLWHSQWEKISPRALPTHAKLAQGLNPALARMEAAQHQCYEALQLSANGSVSEASSASIFWLKQSTLFTPALSTGALAGVIRRRLMELAKIPVQEGEFPLAHLRDAEAVFLTSAAQHIVPVRVVEPQGIQWKSEDFIQPFHQLIEEDMRSAAT